MRPPFPSSHVFLTHFICHYVWHSPSQWMLRNSSTRAKMSFSKVAPRKHCLTFSRNISRPFKSANRLRMKARLGPNNYGNLTWALFRRFVPKVETKNTRITFEKEKMEQLANTQMIHLLPVKWMVLECDADRCKYLNNGTIMIPTKGRITSLLEIIIIFAISLFDRDFGWNAKIYLAECRLYDNVHVYICHLFGPSIQN